MPNEDSLLKDLARLIPGYGAYLDEESRRQDDRLTREFLVSRLQDCKSKLDQMGAACVAAGDLSTPAVIEGLRKQIDLAQTRLRAAVEGYSGWFSQRKVDADLLKQVAELDANLVSVVDQMDATLTTLSSTKDFSLEQTAELREKVDLLHTRIDRRAEILKAAA